MSIKYAISIRQPYVELILQGKKVYEYRSMLTKIRGEVYLYASLQPGGESEDFIEAGKDFSELPKGCIVGSVEIVDCFYEETSEEYYYQLANPKRFKTFLHATNQPQPRFWIPQFKKFPMNMFKPTKATNIPDYIACSPAERKADFEFLHNFIIQTVPLFQPHFAFNMIGYGSFPYVNAKKETVSWPVISLANQKNYISLYVCALDNGQYIAEMYAKELGKVKVGKSCINIKKLEDIDLEVLKKVLLMAEKKPGLVR